MVNHFSRNQDQLQLKQKLHLKLKEHNHLETKKYGLLVDQQRLMAKIQNIINNSNASINTRDLGHRIMNDVKIKFETCIDIYTARIGKVVQGTHSYNHNLIFRNQGHRY